MVVASGQQCYIEEELAVNCTLTWSPCRYTQTEAKLHPEYYCITVSLQYCRSMLRGTGGELDASKPFGHPPNQESHKVLCGNCFMVISEKAAPVTGTTLRTTDPVPADYRR